METLSIELRIIPTSNLFIRYYSSSAHVRLRRSGALDVPPRGPHQPPPLPASRPRAGESQIYRRIFTTYLLPAGALPPAPGRGRQAALRHHQLALRDSRQAAAGTHAGPFKIFILLVLFWDCEAL